MSPAPNTTLAHAPKISIRKPSNSSTNKVMGNSLAPHEWKPSKSSTNQVMEPCTLTAVWARSCVFLSFTFALYLYSLPSVLTFHFLHLFFVHIMYAASLLPIPTPYGFSESFSYHLTLRSRMFTLHNAHFLSIEEQELCNMQSSFYSPKWKQ